MAWILRQLGSIKCEERKLTSLDLTRSMPRLHWCSVSLHQHPLKYQTLLTQRPSRLLLTSNNQRLRSVGDNAKGQNPFVLYTSFM